MWWNRGTTISRTEDWLEQALDLASRASETQSVIEACLDCAIREFGAHGAALYLPDDHDPGLLRLTHGVGATQEFPEVCNRHESLMAHVFASHSAGLIRPDSPQAGILAELGTQTKAAILVPVRLQTRALSLATLGLTVAGTLLLTWHDAPHWTPHTATRAEAYGNVFSLAYSNTSVNEFKRTSLIECIEQISTYIESKDPYRAGHAYRSARISFELGRSMDLDEGTLEELRTAATVMDIGYVAIPDSIIYKPEKLTDEEFLMVRMHPVVSYEICQKLQLPESILNLIRSHHEKLDGSGYPDRLRGNEISLPARILTVADAYDAMRCSRAHRGGMQASDALRNLMVVAGTKVDPTVVQALASLIQRGELDFLYHDPLAA